LRDAHIVVICYSVDDENAPKNIKETWLPIKYHFAANVPTILLGLRSDLPTAPAVQTEIGKIANSTKASNLQCSAKDGTGIVDFFGVFFFFFFSVFR
jgi:GTPase SAR1 family protein